jgi:trk system potassium uptake protein TrkA
VNQVVFPEREAAERLARHLGSPNLLDYINLGDDYSLHEMAPPSSFLGKTLQELALPARFNVRVLAIRDALTEKVQVNPGADCRIRESDALLLLGRNEDLARIKQG